MPEHPGYTLSMDTARAVGGAIRFGRRFSRENINVTPTAEVGDARTTETVIWPVEITAAPPGAHPDELYYLYPATLWLYNSLLDPPWDSTDCWVRTLDGHTLDVGDVGLARLVGWRDADGTYDAMPIYTFVCCASGSGSGSDEILAEVTASGTSHTTKRKTWAGGIADYSPTMTYSPCRSTTGAALPVGTIVSLNPIPDVSGEYWITPVGYATDALPGLVSETAQTFGGVKTFDDGATTGVWFTSLVSSAGVGIYAPAQVTVTAPGSDAGHITPTTITPPGGSAAGVLRSLSTSGTYYGDFLAGTSPGSGKGCDLWIVPTPRSGGSGRLIVTGRYAYWDPTDGKAYTGVSGTILPNAIAAGGLVVDLGSGSWQAYTTVQEEGTPLTQRSAINCVGTGFTASDDAGNSRTNLTLATNLNAFASLTGAADTLPYFTGSGTLATTGLTSFGRDLIDSADAAEALATLGLGGLATWQKVTKTYSDLAAASTTNDIEVYSLPAKGVLHAAIIKHTTQFSGGGIVTYSVSVGVSSFSSKYANPLTVSAAVANTTFSANGGTAESNKPCPENFGSATSIRLFAISFGANLNAATAGSVDVYLLISTLP